MAPSAVANGIRPALLPAVLCHGQQSQMVHVDATPVAHNAVVYFHAGGYLAVDVDPCRPMRRGPVHLAVVALPTDLRVALGLDRVCAYVATVFVRRPSFVCPLGYSRWDIHKP